MLAYSGRYRIEGHDFVTHVDASWNEEWNGSEQRRHFRVERGKLFVESAPAPGIVFPGKTDFRRIVWEREK
jgi:lipocalin-like protein